MTQATQCLHPVRGSLIVKPDKATDVSEGGIHLPEAAREQPATGKVLAVGLGRILENGDEVRPEVKEGDKVYFRKYAGATIELGDEELLILGYDELLAFQR